MLGVFWKTNPVNSGFAPPEESVSMMAKRALTNFTHFTDKEGLTD